MHFRRALSFAIPRTEIRDVIFNGRGRIVASIIAPANKFWHNFNIPLVPEDINMAKEELKDAGYTWDSEGKLHYPNKVNGRRVFDSGPGL